MMRGYTADHAAHFVNPSKTTDGISLREDAVAFLTREIFAGEGIDARHDRQRETRIEAQFRASNKEREIP